MYNNPFLYTHTHTQIGYYIIGYYAQTYIILKSAWDESSPTLTVHHDVLFRFGSW
jgi:hypothetical protein